MKRNAPVVFFGLFCIGVVFRLWFVSLVTQPFVYDQEEYYGYALGILKNGLHADLYRLYGYPLIITPLIYFFGVTSPLPWTIFHAILDTTTAFLVFWIGKKLFHSEKPAWIAFILYLFNPFTAGYVGVLLSEIIAIFFTALIFVFFLVDAEKPRLLTGSFLAFLLGYYVQIKPGFLWFSLIALAVVVIRRIRIVAVMMVLFLLPFSYNLVGNWKAFGEVNPMMVDRVFARELYTSLFIGRGLAFTDTQFGVWPQEAYEVWNELSRPKNARERDTVAKKYIDSALAKIKSDPVWFIRTRIAKMGYVWEKHFVFPYAQGKSGDLTKSVIYWGNLAILGLAIVGFVRWIRGTRGIRGIGSLVILLVVYISAVHAFSTSEERFSLPAYPMVFLFAGYGLWLVGRSKLFKAAVIDKR